MAHQRITCGYPGQSDMLPKLCVIINLLQTWYQMLPKQELVLVQSSQKATMLYVSHISYQALQRKSIVNYLKKLNSNPIQG